MKIDNEYERKFYEIEAIQNNWSKRELIRQFNSAIYERLTLSRDKKNIKELAKKRTDYRKTNRCFKGSLCT